jgi:2-oxoisovalerate dehydrogenase E1 component
MSLRAARELAGEGVSCRVLDLRWLNPLPVTQLVGNASQVGRVLVVDETRHGGGAGEGVIAALVEHGVGGPIARVAALDSYVPLGDAADLVLVSTGQIVAAVRRLVG